MSARLAILATGLVTSVGLYAPAACAAIRAGVSNPTESGFLNSAGELISVHEVPLEQPWRGRVRLVKMAAMAVTECLAGVSRDVWRRIPLLVCVAERERPGRTPGLEGELLAEIQQEVGEQFSPGSLTIPLGRVATAHALQEARRLLGEDGERQALIVATDSLLSGPTLGAFDREGRLLGARNSNGFIPGEGAGALLVGRANGPDLLCCSGLGFATEAAYIASGQPLRGDGLTQAIKAAVRDAGCGLQELDFRIADLSGEHYYFKEAALALGRALRVRKPQFELWQPGTSIGESGALAGVVAIAVADAACRKGYSPGPGVLLHLAADAGQRAAAVLQFGGS